MIKHLAQKFVERIKSLFAKEGIEPEYNPFNRVEPSVNLALCALFGCDEIEVKQPPELHNEFWLKFKYGNKFINITMNNEEFAHLVDNPHIYAEQLRKQPCQPDKRIV